MSIMIELLARTQIDARSAVEGFGSAGVVTAIDPEGAGVAADASGEVAVNLPYGFQIRGRGDARGGTGSSTTEPAGGAALVAASPPGLLTTEVEQRLDLHRLPSLFDGRARAPGRYDELATTLRMSIASGSTREHRAVILPVTVERVATRPDDHVEVTHWRLAVAAAFAGGGDTDAVLLQFRDEWFGDRSLHHLDLFDVRTHARNGYVRLRLGGSDVDPQGQSESASGLAYRKFEGELTARGCEAGRCLGLGVASDFAYASDGVLIRETRLTADTSDEVLGGVLALAGFVAYTSVWDPMTFIEIEDASRWTVGAKTSYTYVLGGVEFVAATEAGYGYHGQRVLASLSAHAVVGTRPTPNRVAELVR